MKSFVRTPFIGSIVKVYLTDREFTFGKVKAIASGYDMEDEIVDTREIAILERLAEKYHNNEVDFFFIHTT